MIGLLRTNHIYIYLYIYLYYNGVREFLRKRSMLKVKQLKQRKIFEVSLTESPIYKKQQTSATIREILISNLETGRPGETVQNRESPGLFGRVDSTVRATSVIRSTCYYGHFFRPVKTAIHLLLLIIIIITKVFIQGFKQALKLTSSIIK